MNFMKNINNIITQESGSFFLKLKSSLSGLFTMGKLTGIMGGALALSLLGNVLLLKHSEHQVEKKVECTQAVQQTNKTATEKKVVIEHRQEVSKNENEVRLRTELAALRKRVQDRRGGIGNLPGPTNPATTTDSPSPSPVFLSEDDELTCDTNTILAAAWQSWYAEQVKIRDEENASHLKGNGVSVP